MKIGAQLDIFAFFGDDVQELGTGIVTENISNTAVRCDPVDELDPLMPDHEFTARYDQDFGEWFTHF